MWLAEYILLQAAVPERAVKTGTINVFAVTRAGLITGIVSAFVRDINAGEARDYGQVLVRSYED